jgi:hypothetical protein
MVRNAMTHDVPGETPACVLNNRFSPTVHFGEQVGRSMAVAGPPAVCLADPLVLDPAGMNLSNQSFQWQLHEGSIYR